MQDPDDDAAWKPELAQILNDGNCFDILLDAYHEAQQHSRTGGAGGQPVKTQRWRSHAHERIFSRDYAEGWCAGNDNAIQ